jgi:glutathione-regulated potassium-efflux system protein KefB
MGQSAFGILLFQDLAVIPLLAVLPLLSPGGERLDTSWVPLAKAAGMVLLIVLAGRFLLRPAFRLVASARSQDVFTHSALLLTVGTALLASTVGLSMALGAFLAGVLLADSEYRHELEADIEPFRGLLISLFFMSVGMSVALELPWSTPPHRRPGAGKTPQPWASALLTPDQRAVGNRCPARCPPQPGRRVRLRPLRTGGGRWHLHRRVA